MSPNITLSHMRININVPRAFMKDGVASSEASCLVVIMHVH